MKVKKLGHCCLRIETKGLTILTDPGTFSTGQDSETGIDLILITHEHADHLHIDSLKTVLKNNPQAKVVSNKGVGKILDEAGINYELLEGTSTTKVKDVALEAFDCRHEEIYKELGQVQNTGYFIDGRLFYPGDSFGNPKKKIEILAWPAAGPWCRIADAINYALKMKPQKLFPVHDGGLTDQAAPTVRRIPGIMFKENGIEFVELGKGDEKEF